MSSLKSKAALSPAHKETHPSLVGKFVVGVLCLAWLASLAVQANDASLLHAAQVAPQSSSERMAASSQRLSSFLAYPEYSDRWRIGFGCARDQGYVTEYDVAQLCAGWYHDWGTLRNPPCPDGLEYIQHVRVAEKHFDLDHPWTYGWDSLQRKIEDNPGAIWVIGNEPDGRAPDACDSRFPAEYAQIYKIFYDFIKGVDPTAKLANGPIIQGTPVRMQWLTQMWDYYKSQYGTNMPVDVWTMHNQIVKERPSEGADIPLGCDPELGRNYGVQDNDNMDLFIDHTERMRQWMKNRGQRSKPLYLTEYGVLQPQFEGFTEDRIAEYLNASFTYLLYATDSSIGMQGDSNRLVQRWAWFALNVPEGRLGQQGAWNGTLFDPETHEITEVGRVFSLWACAETHPTPTPDTTPYPSIIVREAEHGSTHGSMARGETNSASDCRYVHIPPVGLSTTEDDDVTFNVYIPDTGEYALWGRGRGIDYANKSFSLQVSNYNPEAWYFGVGGWNWQKAPTDSYDLEGRRWHTITIGPRVGGRARLDLLVITSDLGYDPRHDPDIIAVCNPTPTKTPTPQDTPTRTATPTVTRTPMPPGPGRISGNVAFQGRGTPPAASWVGPLFVSAHLPGDPIPAYQFNADSDEEGSFLVPSGVLPGRYDVGVRDLHSLRNLRRRIWISDHTADLDMGTLIEGDADGNGEIGILDFSMLAAAFGSARGDAGWDERADFNNDGAVTVYDFSLLASNYGQQGDVTIKDQGLESSGLNRSPANLGTVSVYVSPATSNVLVDQVFTVDVYADAGSNQVNSVGCDVTFNPTYLRALELIPGTALDSKLLHEVLNDRVRYAYGRLGSSVSGTFLLFTIRFRARQAVASTALNLENLEIGGPPPDYFHTGVPHNGTVVILAASPTPTRTNTPIATQVPAPTATNVPGPGVQEIVLQQGVDDYTGFEDTYIDAWDEEANFHADQHLKLRAPNIKRILIRADLTILDPGTVIREAVLTLYQGSGSGNPLDSSVYGIVRGWEAETVTWLRAAEAVPWEAVGCDAPNTDRAADPTTQREIFPTFGSYENYPFDFDVTDLVQAWVNDPGANQGLLIVGTSGAAVEFAFRSSDYYDTSVRPRLMIRYGGLASTATPTATSDVTSTPTLTPTPLPSATPTGSLKGAIRGVAYEDQNGNGRRDVGEPGVPGVIVELRDMGNPQFHETRSCDVEGRYAFEDLDPGTYRMTLSHVPPRYLPADDWPLFVPASSGVDRDIPIALRSAEMGFLPLIYEP